LVWVWDKRENVFFPESGYYFQAEGVWYGSAIGSDYDYARYLIDLRRYFGLGRERVIAAQLVGNFASGAAPFYDLPMLGGGNIMRGYYQGRYRDYVFTAAQGEVRWPLFGRFGAVGFVAAGTVAPALDGFDLGDLRWSGGGGLRFRFNQAEKVNLRADIGFAEGGTGIYFGLEEAF
jgi:outer membrane protein assembly factor BamA